MNDVPLRARWGILLLATAILGPAAGLCFYGATQADDASNIALRATIGVLCLVPLALGARTTMLARRGRKVVVDDAGIHVPHLLFDRVDVIPWPAFRALEDRTTRVRGIKADRSLLIYYDTGTAQVREGDVGPQAFTELKALLVNRLPPPSPEFERRRRRKAFVQIVVTLAAIAAVGIAARALSGPNPEPRKPLPRPTAHSRSH